MGSAFKLLEVDDPQAAMQAVFALEKQIAAVTKPPAALRDPYAVYNLVDLEQLQASAPAFDFVSMSKSLVGPKAAESVTPNTQVSVVGHVLWYAHCMMDAD